jgi:hypothetical protein
MQRLADVDPLSDQVFVDRQLAPLPAANSNRTQIVQAACGNSLTSSAPAFALLATAQAGQSRCAAGAPLTTSNRPRSA